jgi:hypothetical protein
MVLTPVSFPGPQYGVATLKSIRKISVSLNVLFTFQYKKQQRELQFSSKEELRMFLS